MVLVPIESTQDHSSTGPSVLKYRDDIETITIVELIIVDIFILLGQKVKDKKLTTYTV